jgi:hypothetical protein
MDFASSSEALRIHRHAEAKRLDRQSDRSLMTLGDVFGWILRRVR